MCVVCVVFMVSCALCSYFVCPILLAYRNCLSGFDLSVVFGNGAMKVVFVICALIVWFICMCILKVYWCL